MAPTEREKRLHMLLSDEEDRMLRALADADGLTASDIVRQLIRRTFMERWPPKPKIKK
jgi:hypothetical protein